MPGLFAGTSLERPVTCEACEQPLEMCKCPRDAQGTVRRPKDQAAIVQREKRRGHFVTTISGIDPVASDLPAILSALKSKASAGGTITKEHVLEVQGDHSEMVAELLRERGYKVKISGARKGA